MSQKLADAVLYLTTDASKLDKGLASAETKTKKWGGRIGTVAKGAAKNVAATAAIVAAAAVTAVGKAAWDVSTDTERAAADIAASLGIPTEKAREFAEVARQVYGDNFADSVGEAGDAVADIAKQLNVAADDPALKTITENAFRMKDAFGTDVPESIDAVKTLMENFGLSADEAFDMVAKGYQVGLDRSGDFLDTINEYSTQFKSVGFEADEFFSILSTGSQGGMLGTDKVADAVKEMGIILNEGSDDTKAAFTDIGLEYNKIAGYVSSGDEAWSDYFPKIITGLNSIEDPIKRSQLEVALFGTMAEDMGVGFTQSLDAMAFQMQGTEGSIASLDAKYETFGQAASAVWRRLIVAVSPMTDKLLEIVNDAMPHVMKAFDWFEDTGLPAIQAFSQAVGRVVSVVIEYFQGLGGSVDEDGTGRFEYFKNWIDENLPRIQALVEEVLGAIMAFWEEHGETIMEVVGNMLDNIYIVFDTALNLLLDYIQFWLQLLSGDWEGALETLQGMAERIWLAIQGIFSNQLDSIKAILDDFSLVDAGKALVDGIKQGIQERWDSIPQWFGSKLQGLRDMLPFSEPKDPSSPLRGLKKSGQALVEEFQRGIDTASLGLGNLSLGGMQTAGAASGGNVYHITVPVSGAATYDDGRNVARGIQDELRARGLA